MVTSNPPVEMAPPDNHTNILAKYMADEEQGRARDSSYNDDQSIASTSAGGSNEYQKAAAKTPQIAHRENMYVFYTRSLVLFVLFISTALVAYFTWNFVSTEENDDFKAQVRFVV